MRLISTITLACILAGCASAPAGVKMTDEEAAACKAEGCTAWTDGELQLLIRLTFQAGFQRGAQSTGRAL